jgi:hypothetical protein
MAAVEAAAGWTAVAGPGTLPMTTAAVTAIAAQSSAIRAQGNVVKLRGRVMAW